MDILLYHSPWLTRIFQGIFLGISLGNGASWFEGWIFLRVSGISLRVYGYPSLKPASTFLEIYSYRNVPGNIPRIARTLRGQLTQAIDFIIDDVRNQFHSSHWYSFLSFFLLWPGYNTLNFISFLKNQRDDADEETSFKQWIFLGISKIFQEQLQSLSLLIFMTKF